MAKSIRSKRARKFRAVKREKNEVIERKRLYAVTAKLGTLPPDVIVEDDTPKHFVHTAPLVRPRAPRALPRRSGSNDACSPVASHPALP